VRSDRIILFTDGSFRRGRMGAGYLAHDGARMSYGSAPVEADVSTSVMAEAHALAMGVRRAMQSFPATRLIEVVTDSDATVRTIQGWMRPSEAHEAIFGKLAAEMRAAGASLSMHWTPAHLDESTPYGFANAVVDRLAGLGCHGRRIGRTLPYGRGWAQSLRRSDPRLSALPRFVGHGAAAAWLGVDPEFIPALVANGHLAAAEAPGLVQARSIDAIRPMAARMGLAAQDPTAWEPGPLDAPVPPPDAVLAVAAFRASGLAAAGGVLDVGGARRNVAGPVTARQCPQATAIDSVTEMLGHAGAGLRPLTRLRVIIADESTFRLVSRLDPPETKAARLALGRLSSVGERLRVRLAVSLLDAGSAREAGMLADARRLALSTASAIGAHANGPAEPASRP
jgi:ribonuclease HI